MYTATEITVCPFSNMHSAAQMYVPNILTSNTQSTCLTVNNVHVRSRNMRVVLFAIDRTTPVALRPGRLNSMQQSKLGIERRSSLPSRVSANMSNIQFCEITSSKLA
ncbi:hypothetical protein TNCV_4780501 [Trichonephila clavipes]|nr:hypothetical protein TNCV_4780501 [Trichonephila clavipes]